MLLHIDVHLISSQNLPWAFIWDYDCGFLTLTRLSESRYVPLASWWADYLLLLVLLQLLLPLLLQLLLQLLFQFLDYASAFIPATA